MKCRFEVMEISKEQCLEMIRRYHYSNTLPKINKHFLGFFLEGELVGVLTLGWGTRPKHTIKRLFPSLDTRDYFEIGRMCMTDDMPRNSESQMLSQAVKWIRRNCPEVKVLFTWADGMLGKVGYVYQAANFTYAGYSEGEMYMQGGIKIHARQMKSVLLKAGQKDERITIRPTLRQLRENGINHFKGKQYRYIYFLCDRHEISRLKAECKVSLSLPRPKDNDLAWRKRNVETGKWEECEAPVYVTDIDQRTKGIVKMADHICDECGKPMWSGYLIDDNECYCSDECLHKHYSEEEYMALYEADAAYWTEWEE